METGKNSPAVERLQQFMDYIGMSNSQFADKAGIPRPTLSQLLHGRNKSINDVLLRKLNEAFPQLNIVWLLFGRGDMLTDANNETSEAKKADFSGNNGEYVVENQSIASEENSIKQSEFSFGNREDSSSSMNFDMPNIEASTIFASAASMNRNNAEGEMNDGKKIQLIIVVYSDNSLQTFTPS